MTTTQQHEAVKAEEGKVAGPVVAKAVAEEEKRRKAEEEEAGKEPVRSKILRLVGKLRGGGLFGGERKAAWAELEGAAARLKSEQLMGELTEAEEKEKKEREKAEREAKGAEEKSAKAG